MFTPRQFRVDDPDELVAFMRRYSFCTLITPTAAELAISHVPVLVDQADGAIRLIGHLAAPNPHGKALHGSRTTVVFNGPHSYISPAWYAEAGEVPTWNYASVHASGTCKTFNDAESLSIVVDRMIDTYEKLYDNPWNRQIAADYRAQQLTHIIGFEIVVEELSGKYKLGQNRSQADQNSMLAQLEASADQDSQTLARFIRRVRKNN